MSLETAVVLLAFVAVTGWMTAIYQHRRVLFWEKKYKEACMNRFYKPAAAVAIGSFIGDMASGYFGRRFAEKGVTVRSEENDNTE